MAVGGDAAEVVEVGGRGVLERLNLLQLCLRHLINRTVPNLSQHQAIIHAVVVASVEFVCEFGRTKCSDGSVLI